VSQGSSATFNVTVTNTSGNALPADNSTVTVTLPAGLTPTSALSFPLGPLTPGGAKTFAVTATATALGAQTVTAAVTSPDASPNSASASTTISVVTATTSTTQAPVGSLTPFAFGFGPSFVLDLFEVDSQGNVFTQAFGFLGLTGSPVFLSNTLQLSAAALVNTQVLAFLQAGNQVFLVELFNFFNPFVSQALLANPLAGQVLLTSVNR
jgi:hypothetical protein